MMDEGRIDAEAYIEKYDDYLSQGAKKQIELAGKREATAHERAVLFDFCALTRAWLRDCLVTREGGCELLAYPEWRRAELPCGPIGDDRRPDARPRCRQKRRHEHLV